MWLGEGGGNATGARARGATTIPCSLGRDCHCLIHHVILLNEAVIVIKGEFVRCVSYLLLCFSAKEVFFYCSPKF